MRKLPWKLELALSILPLTSQVPILRAIFPDMEYSSSGAEGITMVAFPGQVKFIQYPIPPSRYCMPIYVHAVSIPTIQSWYSLAPRVNRIKDVDEVLRIITKCRAIT